MSLLKLHAPPAGATPTQVDHHVRYEFIKNEGGDAIEVCNFNR